MQRKRRARVAAALQAWQAWTGRRKEERDRVTRIRQLMHLHLTHRCLQQWETRLSTQIDDRRMYEQAVLHHRHIVLPAAVHLWADYAVTRSRHRDDRRRADLRRRTLLLADALHSWARLQQQCREQEAAAAGQLLPLRLHGVMQRWVRWSRMRRAVSIAAPVALHTLYTWLSLSFHHPLPYPSSPSPTPSGPPALPTLLSSTLKSTRVPSFSTHQQQWRLWIMRRLWEGWSRRVQQWKVDRQITHRLTHLTTHHLLHLTLHHWHSAHLAHTLTTRHLTLSTLRHWRRLTHQRRQRREVATTAILTHRFHLQRRCFGVWRARHEVHQQEVAVAAEEESKAQGMEEVAVASHHRRRVVRAMQRWRGWVVHQLLKRCTDQLVQSRWEEQAKAATLTHWRSYLAQRKQAKAVQRQRQEMADVVYVGKLMSVLFVCWRLQLQRRLTLHRLLTRRAHRLQRELMQRWKAFVTLSREERSREREEEDRRRRADDQRKAVLLARAPLLAAWGHWRRLMAVVAIGHTLATQRRQRLLQRVLQGWVAAAEERKRRRGKVGEALRRLVVRWGRKRRQEEATRAVRCIAAVKAVRRERVRKVFAGWARVGVEDYQQRQRALTLHHHRLIQEVWTAWTNAALPSLSLLQAQEKLTHTANLSLVRCTMNAWRHLLHLRRVLHQWGAVHNDFDGFVHWREKVLRTTWQGWRSLLVEGVHERRADEWHRTTALVSAVRGWQAEVQRIHRARVCEDRVGRVRVEWAVGLWLRVVRGKREERGRVSAMVSALTALRRPSSVDLPSLLLSTLRPSLPSHPLSHYFHRLHTYTQHQRTRTQWAAHITRTLDKLLLRTAWGRWRVGWEALSRRRGRFLLRRAFWTWKLQARRVRERRQLLGGGGGKRRGRGRGREGERRESNNGDGLCGRGRGRGRGGYGKVRVRSLPPPPRPCAAPAASPQCPAGRPSA